MYGSYYKIILSERFIIVNLYIIKKIKNKQPGIALLGMRKRSKPKVKKREKIRKRN